MEEQGIEQESSDLCVFKELGAVQISGFNPNTVAGSKLLALSNKYGLVFVATTKGFIYTKTTNITKATASSEAIFLGVDDANHVATSHDITQLILSADELIIAVDSGNTVKLFDVTSITRGDVKPLHMLDFESSIQVITSAPSGGAFAILLSSGALALFDSQISQKTHIEANGCSSVCFTTADRLAYGRQDGTIVTYDIPKKKVISSIPLPESIANQLFQAHTLHFAGRFLIAAYRSNSTGADVELSSTFFYELANGEVKSVCSRSAEYIELARESTYFVLYIQEWHNILLGHNNTPNIAVLKVVVADKHVILVELELPESGRASLPIGKYGDTHLLGLALSYTCANLPMLFLLNNEGKLIFFSYSNKDAPLKPQPILPLPSSSGVVATPEVTASVVNALGVGTLFGASTPFLPSYGSAPISESSGGSLFGSSQTTSTTIPLASATTAIFSAITSSTNTPAPSTTLSTETKSNNSIFGTGFGSTFSTGAGSFGVASVPTFSTASPTFAGSSASALATAAKTFNAPLFGTTSAFSSGSIGIGSGSIFGTPATLPVSKPNAPSATTVSAPLATKNPLPLMPNSIETVPPAFVSVKPSAPAPVPTPLETSPQQLKKPAALSFTTSSPPKPSLSTNSVAGDVKGPLESQVQAFGKELNKLRALRAAVLSSTPAHDIAVVQNRTEELLKTFEGVSTKYKEMEGSLNALHSQYLAGVADVEEIGGLIEAQNDPTMQELLFSRRLDPESIASRTKMVNSYQDIERNIHTMGEHLEQMWAARRTQSQGGLLHKSNPTRSVSANKHQNSMEHVYRTLNSHYNIACQQAAYVDELGALFNNLVLSKQAMSGPSRLRVLSPPTQSRPMRITASPSTARKSKQQRMQALHTVIATRVRSNNQMWQVVDITPPSFQLSDSIVPLSEHATKSKLTRLSPSFGKLSEQNASSPKAAAKAPVISTPSTTELPKSNPKPSIETQLPNFFAAAPTTFPAFSPKANSTRSSNFPKVEDKSLSFLPVSQPTASPLFKPTPKTDVLNSTTGFGSASGSSFSFAPVSTSSPSVDPGIFLSANSKPKIVDEKESEGREEEYASEEASEGSSEESDENEEEYENDEGEEEAEKEGEQNNEPPIEENKLATTAETSTPSFGSLFSTVQPPAILVAPSTASATPTMPMLTPPPSTATPAVPTSSTPASFSSQSSPTTTPFFTTAPTTYSVFGTTAPIFSSSTPVSFSLPSTIPTSSFGSSASSSSSSVSNVSPVTPAPQVATHIPPPSPSVKPTESLFGQSVTATPSLFGSSPSITHSTFGTASPPFAVKTAHASAFATNSTPASVPATTTSIFGAAPSVGSAFGSAFNAASSSPAASSIFGTSTTAPATTSPFGGNVFPNPSPFGQTTATSVQPAPSLSFGGFGLGSTPTPSSTSNPFGRSTASAVTPASTQQSPFGFAQSAATPTSTATTSGPVNAPATSLFGGGSSFGATNTPTSYFGATSNPTHTAFGSVSSPASAFGSVPAPTFGSVSTPGPSFSGFGASVSPGGFGGAGFASPAPAAPGATSRPFGGGTVGGGSGGFGALAQSVATSAPLPQTSSASSSLWAPRK
jgi:hypothetical protein